MSDAVVEFVAGCAFVAVAVVAYLNLNAATGDAFAFGAQSSMRATTFPNFLAIGLGVLGALFAMAAARRLVEQGNAAAAFVNLFKSVWSRETAIALAIIVLLIAYAFLLKKVHFGLLTFIFLAAGFVLFGRRKPVPIIIVAAAASACFYGLFVGLLQLALNP
ncbi:MAG: tripartite tricarboxylate transporter TctB family protein [Phyllobacteriaceae bacterium]|nr:tripartite tricarboxylate transporter TctB family protein [Phyllobacteriaceae bacterium]